MTNPGNFFSSNGQKSGLGLELGLRSALMGGRPHVMSALGRHLYLLQLRFVRLDYMFIIASVEQTHPRFQRLPKATFQDSERCGNRVFPHKTFFWLKTFSATKYRPFSYLPFNIIIHHVSRLTSALAAFTIGLLSRKSGRCGTFFLAVLLKRTFSCATDIRWYFKCLFCASRLALLHCFCQWNNKLRCLLFVSVPRFQSLNDEVFNGIVDVMEEVCTA